MFKKVSKIFLVVALVAVLTMGVFSLVACNDNTPTGEKSVTIRIGDELYTAKTEAKYVHDLLLELDDKGEITYEYTNSDYGPVVSRLNDLITTTDWSKWVAVFHSIDDIKLRDMSEYALPNIIFGETTYFSSGVGVGALPVIDGASYLFKQN